MAPFHPAPSANPRKPFSRAFIPRHRLAAPKKLLQHEDTGCRYAKFPPFPQKLGQPLGRCFEAHTTLFRRYVISGYDPTRLVQSLEHKNSTVRNRLRIYVCLSGKVVLAPEPVSSPCSQWNTMQRVNQLLSMAGGLR